MFFVLFVSPVNAGSIGKFKKIGTLSFLFNISNLNILTLDDNRIVIYDLKYFNIFNPKINILENVSQPKDIHLGGAIIKLNDGRVFITGTILSRSFNNLEDSYKINNSEYAEIYDPKTDKWVRAARMNYPRRDFGLVKLKDGRLFIYGGKTLDRKFVDTYLPTGFTQVRMSDALYAEIYDPKTDKYTVVGKPTKIEKKVKKYVKQANGHYIEYDHYQKMIAERISAIERAKIPEYRTVRASINQGKSGKVVTYKEEKKLIQKDIPPPLPELKPIEISEYLGGTSNIELLPNGEVIAYYPNQDYAEIFNPETNKFRVVPYEYEKNATERNNEIPIPKSRKQLIFLWAGGLRNGQRLYAVSPYTIDNSDPLRGNPFSIDDRTLYLFNPQNNKLCKVGRYPLWSFPDEIRYLDKEKLLVFSYAGFHNYPTLYVLHIKKKYLP